MSSSDKNIVIGVDIGGTGIKAGAINTHGKIMGNRLRLIPEVMIKVK